MINIKKINDESQTLAYIGHVNNVINGIVPEELKNVRFQAKDFECGFELASPEGIASLGESIFFNSFIYTSRTDYKAKGKSSLIYGTDFVTTGIFIVPKGASINYEVQYTSLDKSLSLADIYAEIYKELDAPFALIGCCELDLVNYESISKSPINNENIFNNQDKYYDGQVSSDDDISLTIMAVVSDPNSDDLKTINSKLSSVLYYNPFANKHKLLSHTHGVRLNKPIIDMDKVRPEHVEDAFHINDTSIVRSFKFKVYKIGDLSEIKP